MLQNTCMVFNTSTAKCCRRSFISESQNVMSVSLRKPVPCFSGTMQRQQSRGGAQRQFSGRNEFPVGNKRQFPNSSSGGEDKRRRVAQTDYGSRQSSYEPRAPSLLDMSITKRMTRQMSPGACVAVAIHAKLSTVLGFISLWNALEHSWILFHILECSPNL